METTSPSDDERISLALAIDPNALEVDAYPWTLNAVERVIAWMAENGYQKHQGPEIQYGHVADPSGFGTVKFAPNRDWAERRQAEMGGVVVQRTKVVPAGEWTPVEEVAH